LNSGGQLGDNSTTDRSSPVSIIGAHSFIQIDAGQTWSLGLKADGSVWAWGDNSAGSLGTNTVINRSSPVSVILAIPTVRTIANIAAGDALYWNGTIAGFNLATTDKIDLNYVET
jgi:alpha-tubulin suppressor-like RCC1 family protein